MEKKGESEKGVTKNYRDIGRRGQQKKNNGT